MNERINFFWFSNYLALVSKTHCILVLVGISLSILQFILIRDFVAILYGEEITIAIVSAAFFVGISIGYLISRKLSQLNFERLFIGSLFLHLTFPFSYRYLAAWISQLPYSGILLIFWLLLFACLFTAVFAIFLPRLVHGKIESKQQNKSKEVQEFRLKLFYTLELVGFILGFFIIISSWNKSLDYLLPIYWFLLLILLLLVTRNYKISAVFFIIACVAISFLTQTDKLSTAALYKYKHKYKLKVEVLHSVNSAYQKIEVIKVGKFAKFLYLNGLRNLDSRKLEYLNYYIAKLPAIILEPKKVLIIGNGTLSSVERIQLFSDKIVSVELDQGVLDAGILHYVDIKKLRNIKKWTLFVEDGKYYLANTKEKYDLIIMDVPAPLTIQVAYLHSVEFYKLVKKRLTANGVLSVQIAGKIRANNAMPAQIVKTLSQVFPKILVITSQRAGRSFAYSSKKMPFTINEIKNTVSHFESEQLKIILPNKIKNFVSKARIISKDNMNIILRYGWYRLKSRYFK